MIAFDEEEEKRIKEICELYMHIKDLFLYGEEINPELKTFTQPYNELRNAFEHMMRILAVKTEVKRIGDEEEKRKYIEDQYDSAKGHIIRCGFDIMDRVSIILRKKISDEVKPFSLESLSKVMPEYYQEIKPDVEEISQEIAKIRENKDIGSTYDIGIKQIEEYVNRIEKLKEYYKQILTKKQPLTEYEEKRRKENEEKEVKQKRALNRQTYILVVATVIAAIIGVVIGKFL